MLFKMPGSACYVHVLEMSAWYLPFIYTYLLRYSSHV